MADTDFETFLTLPRYTTKGLIEQLFTNTEGRGLPRDLSDVNYDAIINVSSIKIEAYMERARIKKKASTLGRFANTVVPPHLNQRFPNVNNRDAILQVIYAATYYGIAELLGFRGETATRDLENNTVTETQAGKYARLAENLLRNIKRDIKARQSLHVGSAQLAVPGYISYADNFETDRLLYRNYTRPSGKAVNVFVAGTEEKRLTNLLYNPQFLILDHPKGWDFVNADEDIAAIPSASLESDYFPAQQNFNTEVAITTNNPASQNIYITDLNSIVKTLPTAQKFQFTHYPFIKIEKNGIYRAEFNLKVNAALSSAQKFFLKILSVKEGKGVPKKTTIAIETLQPTENSLASLIGEFVAFDADATISLNRLPEDHTHFQAFVVSENDLQTNEAIEILSPSIAFDTSPSEQISSGDGYARF